MLGYYSKNMKDVLDRMNLKQETEVNSQRITLKWYGKADDRNLEKRIQQMKKQVN